MQHTDKVSGACRLRAARPEFSRRFKLSPVLLFLPPGPKPHASVQLFLFVETIETSPFAGGEVLVCRAGAAQLREAWRCAFSKLYT